MAEARFEFFPVQTDYEHRRVMHELGSKEKRSALFTQIAAVRNATNTQAKLHAAEAISQIALSGVSDCLSIMHALDTAFEIVVSEKGRRRESGLSIIQAVENHFCDLGFARKLLIDSDDIDGSLAELTTLSQSMARRINHPQLDTHIRRNENVDHFQQFVRHTVSISADRPFIDYSVLYLPDKSIVEYESGTQNLVLKESVRPYNDTQQVILNMIRRGSYDDQDDQKLNNPAEILEIIKEATNPLGDKYPPIYDKKVGEFTMRDLAQAKDQEEFTKIALDYIANTPRGDFFWRTFLMGFFLTTPTGSPQVKLAPEMRLGDTEFMLRMHTFQSWIAESMVKPANPQETDQMIEKLMRENDAQFISDIATLIIANITNQGALNWHDLTKSNVGNLETYTNQQDRTASILNLPEFSLAKNPNKTIRILETDLLPKLEESLKDRFPNELWVKKLLDDLSAKLPKGEISETFEQRYIENLKLQKNPFNNELAVRTALNKLEFDAFKQVVIENAGAIKSQLKNLRCEVPVEVVKKTPFKNAEFFINCDEQGDGKVYIYFTIPGETTVLKYTTSALFNLQDGKLVSPKETANLQDPATINSIEKYVMAFVYDYLVTNEVITKKSPMLDITRLIVGPSKQEKLDPLIYRDSIIEQIGLILMVEHGRITEELWTKVDMYSNAETRRFQAVRSYPGGLRALREKAKKYLPEKSEELPVSDRLRGLLNLLETLDESGQK